jgi:chitinase
MPSNRTGPCKGEDGRPYAFNTLTAIPTQYNVINVAFAVFDPFHPGQVVIQGLSDTAALQLKTDIKTLQARGTKVMLAFGGQDCNWSGITAANAKAYAAAMVTFIEKFGFDGADLDDESVNSVVDEQVLIELVRSLRSALGTKHIITLTPQDVYIYDINTANHTFNTYQTVLNSVGSEIDWVNIMAYNNGIDAKVTYSTWASGFSNPPASWGGFPPSKLVLGLLNSKNSGSSGFLPASTACAAVTELKGKYTDFGGIMTWCTNAEDGSFASALSACLG